jgi:hypothetical protein
MFQLLGLLINYVDRVSGSTDVMVGENPGQNTPASSYQGMLEQGSQVYNMVFKRVWRSMKEEFKKRHFLNAVNLPVKKKFGTAGFEIMAEDYRGNPDMVVPVADPNVTSANQRMMQAQMVREASMTAAGYNRDEVERNLLKAMRIEGIDVLFPGSTKVPPPQDPKLQLEQFKAQAKMMELQVATKQFQMELMETQRLNSAKIVQLVAQARKLTVEAGAVGADLQLRAIDTVVKALQAHNDQINQRLQMMGEEEDVGTGPDGKRVGKRPSGVARALSQLEIEPDNTGIPEALGGMGGSPDASMEGGGSGSGQPPPDVGV